jgi:hypothetical protein
LTFKDDYVKPRKHIVKNNKLKGDSKIYFIEFSNPNNPLKKRIFRSL